MSTFVQQFAAGHQPVEDVQLVFTPDSVATIGLRGGLTSDEQQALVQELRRSPLVVDVTVRPVTATP